MCQTGSPVESLLLDVVHGGEHLRAADAYQRLRPRGVCLSHFCGTLQELVQNGWIHRAGPPRPSGNLEEILEWEISEHPPAGAPPRLRRLGDRVVAHLDHILGQGTSALVYRGEETRLGLPAAVKIFHLSHAVSGVPREVFLERCRREPRALAALRHPHIVHVYDCGEEGEEVWYAMELLEGGSLGDRIRGEGRIAPEDVRDVFRAVADACREAARQGILHRDIKPANIFSRGLKLADFGLAKMIAPPAAGADLTQITRAKSLIGSLPYVAPERARFEPGDERSDIYSLGATMYHAATGNYLFDLSLRDRVKWISAHLSQRPRPVRELVPRFPAPLAAVIERCLEKSPDARFPSFDALLQAIS